MTDAEYREAIDLCRAAVNAATSDDGGPMVAGSFLGRLRHLLDPERVPASPRRYQDLLGCIWLYVNWRYVTTQLTTEQKELWADAVDSFDGVRTADRWWRE
jgi:hypothetical protein